VIFDQRLIVRDPLGGGCFTAVARQGAAQVQRDVAARGFGRTTRSVRQIVPVRREALARDRHLFSDDLSVLLNELLLVLVVDGVLY